MMNTLPYKRILVTGACGFIGGHLVKALVNSGYAVIAYDLENSFNITSCRFSKDISDKIEIFTGNIEDTDSLKKAAEDVGFVFHLAARSFVPDSWKNPLDFYRTNILGTANVLEICRQNNIHLSYLSSYVYGVPEYLPVDEKHPLKSYNPYSQSKLIAEEICDFYHNHYGLKVTIFRPFNVYGPGQNEKFLIPEIIKQVLQKEKEMVEVNDLSPKRDYIFIDDMVEALVLSADGKDGIYNIGSGYSVSVEDLIKMVMKKSGILKKYFSKNITRENEVYDVVADISKVQKALNWSVKTTLEKGIENCILYHNEKLKTHCS